MKLSELREAIKWETEANIPLSLEEVYLDWQIIKPVEKHLNHFDVLINAAPKELVDRYLKTLRAAGIEPVVFEIESVATARSLIKNERAPQPVLIIDLGFSRTSFIIFSGDTIRFTSSVPISNQQMINDVAKKLNINQKEAQELKFKVGLSREQRKLFNALLPSLVKLANQIKDYIAFYKEHVHKIKDLPLEKKSQQADISNIILCGGGAYLKGLSKYFSDHLKVPLSMGNPWINILPTKKGKLQTKKIPPIPHSESLAYSTVLGLALRGTEIKS
jgi:type IV pilus assembly protein PilM